MRFGCRYILYIYRYLFTLLTGTLPTAKVARVFFAISISCISFLATEASAQGSRSDARNDTLKLSERLSYRTNSLGWLLLCPNIGVEFDLRAGDFNKWTIGADILYNWNTSETSVNPYVYDLGQITLEGRKYYRTKRGVAHRDTTQGAFLSWFKHLTRLERKKARTWRAYYWGVYASATKYSFKFSEVGRQGFAYSAGFSFGYGVPLYVMGKGTLDLEVGGRLGMVMTKYDAYTADFESNCYPRLPEKSTDMHVVPFPLLTDFHVSLVYRIKSIRNKYRRINYEKEERDMERHREIENRRDSIRNAKEQRQEEMRNQIEVLKNAKKAKKIRQHQADSLGVDVDSIPLLPAELKAKALVDKLEQDKASEAKAKKEKAKSEKARKKEERKAQEKQRKEAIAAEKAEKNARKEGES